jgi:hypothetical protein
MLFPYSFNSLPQNVSGHSDLTWSEEEGVLQELNMEQALAEKTFENRILSPL